MSPGYTVEMTYRVPKYVDVVRCDVREYVSEHVDLREVKWLALKYMREVTCSVLTDIS